MPMTHAPETGIENPYQKTCTGFLQVCHANRYRFFQYQNLVWSRTVFYSVQETVTKMTSTDWSDDRQLCCLLFYCFKMTWGGGSSIEKLIQKFCFQFHLVRKKLCPKNGTVFWYRFSVPVSGACVIGIIESYHTHIVFWPRL